MVLSRANRKPLRRAHRVLCGHAERVVVCEGLEGFILERREALGDLAWQDVGPNGASDGRSDTTLDVSGRTTEPNG